MPGNSFVTEDQLEVLTTAIATAIRQHPEDGSAAHAASAIGILDSADQYMAQNVEDALAEVKAVADASGPGGSNQAVDITVDDAGDLYTATNVEAALAEVKAIADAGGGGQAANVSIVDSGDLYTATDVEAALAEVKAVADAGGGTLSVQDFSADLDALLA